MSGVAGAEAAIGGLSAEERQTALPQSSHSCSESCKCNTAKCKVCYDLNWKLFEEPLHPDYSDRPPLPVHKSVKNKPVVLEESGKLGCQTCEILWKGIDSFFLENDSMERGTVDYMKNEDVVMELNTGNAVIVLVKVVVHIALGSKVAIEFFTKEGKCLEILVVIFMKTLAPFLTIHPQPNIKTARRTQIRS
jgi:hypothetical protein